MMTPFPRELAAYETSERLRRAEALRLGRSAGGGPVHRRLRAVVAWARSRRAGRVALEPEIRIRFATEHDRATWPELEWRTPEQVLVADFNGAPRAALSIVDGAVLAAVRRHDAAPLVELLELQASGPEPETRPARRFRRGRRRR